ncbi:EF-hand domain-containing protein [Undibacterium sp. TJN25]|uniref:EF-hand domain-containing protein n=1 Tax=Undibacterium sp. TJN25 TaxID=3413056 RepID=UPI003BF14806
MMKLYTFLICSLICAGSWAQEKTASSPPPQILQPPHADPYVPPEKRIAPTQAPASGAALQEQAMQKLKKQFDAADARRSGTLTAEQARAAGLGYVAKNFSHIDARSSGRVSFEQVRQYMEQEQQKQKQKAGAHLP